MEDEIVDIFKEETKPEKPVGKKKRGFRLTVGRCFDFILLSINIAIILFSLIAFVCLAVITATSTSSAAELGLSSKQACLLFAGTNDSLITFTSSGVCYFILASPPVIWCFTAFFIVFLLLKIWRTWNLGFFEIVIFIASLLCLLYAMIASIVLTIGHSLTCKSLAEIDVPMKPGEKQSCTAGGAYYNVEENTTPKFILFAGYFFVAEIALWITCVTLVALSLLHCSRLCIFSRRRSKRAEMAKSNEV